MKAASVWPAEVEWKTEDSDLSLMSSGCSVPWSSPCLTLLSLPLWCADPHPGNLLVTGDGLLVYLDFGMMSELPHRYRIGLIRTVGRGANFLSQCHHLRVTERS